ncbi:MAG: amino acid ABC transporter substrate-binding protein [Deltaproteobacteria bacterium RIFCSPHIGHO2_12_FULL_43_9]|nr:MAG: amino acid ABC transporter substrate-binding protein [Deltaproteobacteria bacterium RIFCSPHIGHO2_12_FULL_43_9]
MRQKENLLIIFFTVVFLAGCSKVVTNNPAENILDEIVKRGELRVGLNAGYYPFEVQNNKGEIVGLDVALANEMAKELGVKLTIINTAWDGIIPSLMSKKFDLIASGMTITLERAKKVSFSDPYFFTGQTVLLNKKYLGKITEVSQLNSPSYTVVAMLGTTGEFAVQKNLPKAKIKVFKGEADAAQEVAFGRADAFVYDQPLVLNYYNKFKDKTYTLLEPFTFEPLGFAVRRGDPDFILWLNHFVRQVKGDGRLQAMVDKYMNNPGWLE